MECERIDDSNMVTYQGGAKFNSLLPRQMRRIMESLGTPLNPLRVDKALSGNFTPHNSRVCATATSLLNLFKTPPTKLTKPHHPPFRFNPSRPSTTTNSNTTMLLQTAIRPVAGRALLPSSSAKAFARTFTALRSPVLRQTLTPVRHHQKLLPKTQFATKRFFTTDPAIVARPTRQQSIQKLLYAGGIFGGTLLGVNFLFNHETREGGIPLYERAYLQETFTYTGLGVGMMGLAAKGLHNMGWSYRLMAMNPLLFLGGGLVATIGTMVATQYTDPDK